MKLLITGGSGFIGTNLIADCLQAGIDLVNVDWNPPLHPRHHDHWQECDIMDQPRLEKIFTDYQPTHVVHLAARTDTDIYDLGGDLNEYVQNTEGTRHVLECIQQNPSVQQAIITSTMFVCQAGYQPTHDLDFTPFTLYGKSKMISELYVREASLDCVWTIIRPQTIWGPWSLRYRDVMFKVMQRGLYFHPSRKNVRRAYGYVGNVVWQIRQILQAAPERVHRQVLYVGDMPIDLRAWVAQVSQTLTGNDVRVLPTPLVRLIALAGDVLTKYQVRFPLTSTRFNSMTQDYLTPIEKTYRLLGTPPYTMEEGVEAFVRWYTEESMAIRRPDAYQVKVAASVQAAPHQEVSA